MKKCAFIIGASSGIGLECAKYFSEKGYDIIATYNSTNLTSLKKECNSVISEIKMDVNNYQSIKEGFEIAFKSSNYIDTVIFCSGICENEILLCDMSAETIQKIINTNLIGCTYVNKEAMHYLIKQKHGNIVNISSIDGVYGCACESAYSASKAGIDGLTRSLALECAPFGVRVNSVAPGFIKTRMTDIFDKDELEDIIKATPLGRLGNTLDIAKAVYFLASDDSSFITGETINVNGGATRF